MHNRNELISMAERNISDLELAIEDSKMKVMNPPFILRIGPIFLTLDVDPKGAVSNPRPGRPDTCLRLSLRDAQNVCLLLSNDNGDIAEPVHIKDALVESLEGQRIFLSQLTAEQLGV